jgi:FkbM family methyltransferase
MGTKQAGGRSAPLNGNEGDWKDWLRDIVRRNHRLRIFELASSAAKTYLRAYHNEDHYRFAHNGELFVIETVATLQGDARLVTFDVGANRGTWTLQLINCCPQAEVHCFEIAPQLVPSLTGTLREFPNARLNFLGLSYTEGTLELKYVPGATSTSTVHEPLWASSWGFSHERVTVPVTTGDKYVGRNGIDHIGILKIDTEGHELSVLKGFAETLKARKISLIQFEHGWVHIASRTLLCDFYQLLHDFAIGRLHPRCVDFKEYDHREDEQFRMGNYIAVHRSKPDWIAALQNS